MTRWLAAGLIFLAWHFATTFFVPAAGGQARGGIAWPFGRSSRPFLISLRGLAPPSVPGYPPVTAALTLAGIASLAFMTALAALFGFLVPTAVWAPAVVLGALASGMLFVLYIGRWALVPLAVDALLLWGVLGGGWDMATLLRSP